MILIGGLILETDGEKVYLDGLALPSVCWWQNTSVGCCPGCGLTRSVISLCHLEWKRSFTLHPAGALIFALVLMELLYRLPRLKGGGGSVSLRGPAAERFLLVLALVVSLASWLWRLVFP